MKSERVSQVEYARRRGVDPTSVRDAIRAGRITLIDGKIDPTIADVQWERNTRKRARAVDERRPDAAAPVPTEPNGYHDARARREQAEAELAELRLAELRGELVRASSVRANLGKRLVAMRESLLQLPARVVPLLVANPEPGAMDVTLRAEITSALTQIVDGIDASL